VTALVFSMLRARWGQALTVFLLGVVAVAAAVAGPVASRAAQAAALRLEIDAATSQERTVSVTTSLDPGQDGAARAFDNVTKLLQLPGFDSVRGGELLVSGPVAQPAEVILAPLSRLVFRDHLCEHVVVLSGRCLSGSLEAMIGEETARREGISAGQSITVLARKAQDGELVSDGRPVQLTVAGIYRPADEREAYWGGRRYFSAGEGGTDEVIFIAPSTVKLVEHTVGVATLDVVAPAPALTPERLAALPGEIETMRRAYRDSYSITSDLPALAQRVQTGQRLAGQLVPVAFLPLAAISIFAIYLAVGYGIVARRHELGLVALRGVSRRRRWLLAAGETALPLLAAVPVGYVVGHLVVAGIADLRWGSTQGAELSLASLPYAAAALAVALAVVLLGQRRVLAQPVVELLRGGPRGRAAWQAFALEALVAVLAVVATVQLRLAGTTRGGAADLAGLGLLVPGLLTVAVALVASRALLPVAGLFARWALRTGRLGTGLAAVQVARRPGSQRLFVLLCVASAMLAFVAAGTDVAEQAREQRVLVQTGAPRVVTLAPTDPRVAIEATHRVDPEGAWAMAVTTVPQSDPDTPPMLAVDASRLVSVPVWRDEYGVPPQEVARALAPPQQLAPFVLTGDTVVVEAGVRPEPGGGSRAPVRTDLELEFVPVNGLGTITVAFRGISGERQRWTAPVPGCAEGCRLTGITLPHLTREVDAVTVYEIGQLGPTGVVAPAAALADASRWRAAEGTSAVAGTGALDITFAPGLVSTTRLRVGAITAPSPVPVALAGDFAAGAVTSLDGQRVRVDHRLRLGMIPRLGIDAVLVDLAYLEATLADAPSRQRFEVWLGEAAPPDAVDRLRDAGLVVLDETGVAQTRAALLRQGPALAIQFHAAAALFGVLLALGGLGLVSAVDRRQRATELAALRVQGLRRRTLRRAALWGYLSVVVAACLAGLGGAAVAWAAAGDRLPIFADTDTVLDPPNWPQWPAVVGPWAAAGAGMVLAATLAAWLLRRAANRA